MEHLQVFSRCCYCYLWLDSSEDWGHWSGTQYLRTRLWNHVICMIYGHVHGRLLIHSFVSFMHLIVTGVNYRCWMFPEWTGTFPDHTAIPRCSARSSAPHPHYLSMTSMHPDSQIFWPYHWSVILADHQQGNDHTAHHSLFSQRDWALILHLPRWTLDFNTGHNYSIR